MRAGLPLRPGLVTLRGALLRLLHGGGRIGLAGIALLVASAVIGLQGMPAVQAEIEALQAERSALRSSRPSGTTLHNASQRLEAWYAGFPARRELPQQLVRLHRLADQHALEASQADYRDARVQGAALTRVRIEIPVTGSYAALRGWISDCLRSMPALALDGIALRRADTGSPRLEARVRFVLFLRTGT